jgi:general stress protein CsbA
MVRGKRTKAEGQAPKVFEASEEGAKKVKEEKDKESTCKICTTHNSFDPTICPKYIILDDKIKISTIILALPLGNNASALSKMCTFIPTFNQHAVLNRLIGLSMSQSEFNDFMTVVNFNTITQTQYVGHILNVATITVPFIQAWEKMHAKKSRGYWSDFYGVKSLQSILNAPAVLTTLGEEPGIDLILEKNVSLGCNTCVPSNAPFLQKMDKYLDDVKYFAGKYGTNGESLIANLKGPYRDLIGAAFQLRVINANKAKFIGATFNLSVADAGEENVIGNATNTAGVNANGLCRYDISVGTGTNLQLYEFKSWGQSFKNSFLTTLSIRESFANQLKAYFRNTNVGSLDQLHYYFDGREGRINETEAKQIVQKALQDKAQAWFTSTDATLISQIKLLFGVTNEEGYLIKINNLDNDVYNFVEAIK